MTEPSYKDGEVVWVKWGNQWWPGEVWSSSRVPSDIVTSLRKPVIAFVKFFQEEAFEFVRSPNNIMQYNCDKKLDFIRKGMDKYRTKGKALENFPADVVKAEQLTKGNVNILTSLETPTKQKPASTTMVTPEKLNLEASPPSTSKKQSGAYNSSSKVQSSASPAPKSNTMFTCTMCDYCTDRINLLMFHIKNHSSTLSPRVSDASPGSKKGSKSPIKKAAQPIDTIADDVRKIKESLKKETKPAGRKSRQPAAVASPALSTPTARSRGAKKAVETVKDVEVKEEEEKAKPEPVNELKNELLADWLEDEDEPVVEKEKVKERPKSPLPTPVKVGESSRSIRNIPKKQRINEVYVKLETPKTPIKESPNKVEKPFEISETSKRYIQEISKRGAKAPKRKITTVDAVSEPETKKLTEGDDGLMMATAELLNETEVPKVESAQMLSTFHIEIDKRNLPPKERNKRMLRANQSRESPPEVNDILPQSDSNGSIKEKIVASPKDEIMLPHKKKQSSRLLTADKPTPARESRSLREAQPSELRARKKRKSIELTKSDETETNSPSEKTTEPVQCPLRDSEEPSAHSVSPHRRGQKRRNSKDIDVITEPKKIHKLDLETQPKSLCGASETILITSKGELSRNCKDTLVTTEASMVTVTSQVIITEAMHKPIVSSAPAHTPKSTAFVKIPTQSLKNAVKFPTEELLEMKKQGLVREVGVDKKNKFTEKGKQIFKKIQEKTVSEAATEEKNLQEPERAKSPELLAKTAESKREVTEVQDDPPATEQTTAEPEVEAIKGSNGTLTAEVSAEESTNNNEVEKDVNDSTPTKEIQDELQENGREVEADPEALVEDTNSGGAGLMALQAETFGGPPNCFYLCRFIEGRYEPVDNQILVLNAQNALVPYDGDISDSLVQTEIAGDNTSGFSQLSPNSNIIINTPNGQKIELNHMAILALQEQADENGIASIELSGEQLDLNINGILEAINAQQEANEGEALLAGAMMIDGDRALILDSIDSLPIEMNHSATQVSEAFTKPIMSSSIAPTEEVTLSKAVEISETVSKNLNIEDSLATIGVTSHSARPNVPKSLELPITITNPVIAETVNHRKLTNAPILGEIAEVPTVDSDVFVVQPTDNGSEN